MIMTTRMYQRSLSILFLAFLGGSTFITAFSGLYVFFNEPLGDVSYEVKQLIAAGIPILMVLAILLTRFVYISRIKALSAFDNRREKFTGYRSAMLVSCAMTEGAIFLSAGAYYFTGDIFCLGSAIAGILSLLFLRPAMAKLPDWLQLSDEERMLLQDPDAALYKESIPE